jgi:hypothetical protein
LYYSNLVGSLTTRLERVLIGGAANAAPGASLLSTSLTTRLVRLIDLWIACLGGLLAGLFLSWDNLVVLAGGLAEGFAGSLAGSLAFSFSLLSLATRLSLISWSLSSLLAALIRARLSF